METTTIFISHATSDEGLARSLSDWIEKSGFGRTFVAQESIVGGGEWRLEIGTAITTCRLLICIITPRWLDSEKWCINEWIMASALAKRVLPLFVLDDEGALETEAKQQLEAIKSGPQGIDVFNLVVGGQFDFGRLPERVETLRRALEEAGVREQVGVEASAFPVNTKVRRSPFPGLLGFGDEDADAAIFFGRDHDIAECLDRLRRLAETGKQRSLVILGASGSGKSSLLKAGIVPRLRREKANWLPLRTFSPGGDPLLSFANAWTNTLEDHGVTVAPGVLRQELLEAWKQASRGPDGQLDDAGRTALWELLEEKAAILRDKARAGPDATILVSIDQAEQLVQSSGGPGDDALASYLLVASQEPQATESLGPLRKRWQIVLTIRTNSLSEVRQHPRFGALEREIFDLPNLPQHRFDNVVELPAKRYGVDVDSRLIDAMVEQASGDDAVPIFAFGLRLLWDRYASTGRLTKEHYDEIGGFDGIVGDAAERALHGVGLDEPLPPRGESSAVYALGARTFIPALVELDGGGDFIMRVAPWSGFEAREQQELLKRFEKWRLVVRKTTSDGVETVEVAHEAIIRAWDRLRRWLEPERDLLKTLRGLSFRASTWMEGGHSPDDLSHSGIRLKEAQALAAHPRYRSQLQPHDHEYLARCQARQRREGWTQKVPQLLLAVCAVAFVLAWTEKDRLESAWFHFATVRSFINDDVKPFVLSEADETALLLGSHTTSTFTECRSGCPEMVIVPSGDFAMGDEGHSPVRKVTIRHPFAVSTTEVTFEQWNLCAAHQVCPEVSDNGYGQRGHPVINVTWHDTQHYVGWLTKMTGKEYRLLSEAEWEYVARAGHTTDFSWGPDIGEGRANCSGCGENGGGRTIEVKTYSANAFGLFDVHGNVWEWVEDCWHQTYENAPEDGAPWISKNCTMGVVRGGDFSSLPTYVRSAVRAPNTRNQRTHNVGFRVARTLGVSAERESLASSSGVVGR